MEDDSWGHYTPRPSTQDLELIEASHWLFERHFKKGKVIPKQAPTRNASLPQHPVQEWTE